MKKLAVCSLLLLAACASSMKAPVPLPDVVINQVYGPSDVPYARGTSSVYAEYAFDITNKADVPITLNHITMQSVGNTTIAMRTEERAFNATIPPGATGEARLKATVYFTSDISGSPTREPFTVRATLHFNSSKGAFVRIVQQNLSQFPE